MPETLRTDDASIRSLIEDLGGKIGKEMADQREMNLRKFEEMEKRFGPLVAKLAVSEDSRAAAEIAADLERNPEKAEKLVRGKPVERKERMLLSAEEDARRGFKPDENPEKALGRIVIGMARASKDRVDVTEGIRRELLKEGRAL